MIANTIGPYRIQSELGRGAMTVVYKAIHERMDRVVALEVLQEQTGTPQFAESFMHEARLAGRLDHPNIVTIYDVGEDQGRYFIAMQFLEGQTLEQRLARDGVIALQEAFSILKPVASALDYAHAQGVVHRDIKPAHIMLGPDGKVTLTDFVIGTDLEDSSPTIEGAFFGTPEYIAPEQIQGTLADARTDVYALGIVLYEMLTGQVPFQADTPLAVVMKQVNDTPPPASQLNPDLSPSVEQVLQVALAKDPGERYQTSGQMIAALERAAGVPASTRATEAEQPPVLRTSTPLDQVEFATAPHLEPAVLVINFAPTIPSEGNRPLRQVLDWNDPRRLAEQYIADLADCSAGYIRYEIAEWLDVDAWPAKTDGFRYDAESYMAAWLSRSGWHEPDALDYEALIAEYDLVGKINSGQIDEVWLFGFPLTGFYESIMVGPGATWCNAPPLDHLGLSRRFVIMGFNYERGVGPMLESFGHRVESMLQQAFDKWQGPDPSPWQRFSAYDRIAPGEAGCGTMHFAPNSVRDYDWGSLETVWSTCRDWPNYPNLTGLRSSVNCKEWGDGDQRAHHLWWLRHLPRAEGGSEGFLHNWWIYAVVAPAEDDERLVRVPQVDPIPGRIDRMLQLLEENAPSGSLGRLLRAGRERDKARQRQEVATALGDVDDPRAVDALIGLLEDPEIKVCLAAGEALGRQGREKAYEPLMEFLRGGDPNAKMDPRTVEALEVATKTWFSTEDIDRLLAGEQEAVPEQEGYIPSPLAPGDVLAGRYQIQDLVEQGGLSNTYRARDLRLEQAVTAKVVDRIEVSPRFPQAFTGECQAFSRLAHPNLVRILDFDPGPERPFLIRQPVGEERSLRDLLAEQGRFPPEETLSILAQAGQALDYIHQESIIHRNVKPGHILLRPTGEGWHAVLLDACITRAMPGGGESLIGTPGYMSPELARGDVDQVGPATDVYGLGLVAYEMLASRAPFEGMEPFEVMAAHVSQDPPSPRDFNSDLSEATSAVLLRALAKAPEDRYPSAGEFVTALEKAATETIREEAAEPEDPLLAEIDAILARLEPLHAEVRQKEQDLAALETELAEASQEYETATRPLREEHRRLHMEITDLQAHLGRPPQTDAPSVVYSPADLTKEEAEIPLPTPYQPDDNWRENLQRLLNRWRYRLYDEGTSPPDQENASALLARLNELLDDPATTMGQVLVQIPWGSAWSGQLPPVETQEVRLKRLETWEEALKFHLGYLDASLTRTRLRHAELQQVHKQGPEAWQAFLDEATARLRQEIDTLEQELNALQKAAGEREGVTESSPEYRLLGAHVNAAVSGLPELIQDWKPPLIVTVHHDEVWHQIKAQSPNTIFVGRLFQENEPDFEDARLDPLQAAREHCELVLSLARQMGATYDYWQGVNEPAITSPEGMARYAEFEVERARIMAENGFRVVVGSFATGGPDLTLYRHFLPALEATRQYGGALALHAYAWPSLERDAAWYALRYRKIYDGDPDLSWQGLPEHLQDLPLLITECGLDSAFSLGAIPSNQGWRDQYQDDPAPYLEQLAWYDAQLQQDPYILGAAIYCCGSVRTANPHDIWPDLARTLAGQARPRYRAAALTATRKLRIGLHGRNATLFAEHDYEAVSQAEIEALTMMSSTDPGVYERLRGQNPDLEFFVRLYDGRLGRGSRPGPADFVDRQVPVIQRLRPFTTRFQIHNEPNHADGIEGWGSSDDDARDFRAWYLEVLQLLREACPWATFGFPALAPGDVHRDLAWLEICRDAIEASDWLACHCYWQGENQRHEAWGQRFRIYHERLPAMRIAITEFGDSTPALPTEILAERYVQYYQALYDFDYLDVACAFIASSPDPAWAPFVWATESGDLRPVVQAVGAMSRPLLAPHEIGYALPPYLFGLNDPGDWRDLFLEAGKSGWVLFSQVLDDDSRDSTQVYQPWSGAGFGVLTRLVNAPYDARGQGAGSIPLPGDYDDFARRCAGFVRRSPGCRTWFIGNEMNIEWHWPNPAGAGPSPITPQDYAACFRRVYRAIKEVQPYAWIIPSGLNPLRRPGVRHEDALDWFRAMLDELDELDGLDIHAYFPLAGGERGDEAYTFEQFIEAVPERWRDLPVFLTEATPPEPWPESGDGWLQRTYARVNRWNCNPGRQPIQALLPYRWLGYLPDGRPDPWNLADKPSYRDDLQQVLRYNYRNLLLPEEERPSALDRAAALECIAVVEADLASLSFDAMAVATDTELRSDMWGRQRLSDLQTQASMQERGFLGALRSTWSRVREDVDSRLELRGLAPLPIGQAAAGEPGELPARHLIYMPVREKGQQVGQQTEEDLVRGLEAALALAERLGDVYHLVLPSITSDWRARSGDAAATARILLSTVLDYLQAGSNLLQVTVALTDEQGYATYARELDTLRREALLPLFWFVTANPNQYDWDRAFDAGSEQWTQVRGAEAQANLRRARPGDVVLAYRSTPDRFLAGLGRIAAEPYEFQDRHAVQIDMDLKFEQGLSLDELRQATPDLQHATRTRPLSFSPVTAAQWATLREWILERNPDLDPAGLPPRHRIEVESVEMPAEGVAGEQIQVTLRLQNQGNFTWREGSQLLVECYWFRDQPDEMPPPDGPAPDAGTEHMPDPDWQWLIEVYEDVPPGGELLLENTAGQVPQQPGQYEARWQVRGLQWQPPVEEARAVRAVEAVPARFSPGLQQALRWAEAFRQAASADEIYTEHLLAALYQEEGGPAHNLLTLFDDETEVEPWIQELANSWTSTSVGLAGVSPVPELPDPLPLSQNGQEALHQAGLLADEHNSRSMTTWHLLAGLLAAGEGVVSYRLPEKLGMERETLHRLLAEASEGLLPRQEIFYASKRRPALLKGHEAAINSLAFGPPLRLVLYSGSNDATVRAWSLLTGGATTLNQGGAVRSVAATLDSDHLFVTLDDGSYTETNLLDGDTTTYAPSAESAEPINLALSPDGHWLASAARYGTASIYEMPPGEGEAHSFQPAYAAESLAIASEGRLLAYSSLDNSIWLWDRRTGKEELNLSGHEDTVECLAFTGDGGQLVSASSDRTLKVWDLETGQERFTLRGHDHAVVTVVTIPGRPWAVSGSADETLRLWDLEAGRALAVLPGHEGGVTALALSPDGRLLASGDGEGAIRLWDLEAVAAGLPQPISREQALARLSLTATDFIELGADAYLNSTNQALALGNTGQKIASVLGPDFVQELEDQAPAPLGSVVVSSVEGLPARYILHTPIYDDRQPQGPTGETVVEAVRAALRRAEELPDLQTLVIPSIGTTWGDPFVASLAPGLVLAAAEHLEQGSRLKRITFSNPLPDLHNAFVEAYTSLGGTIQIPDWYSRLSPTAVRALDRAEHLRHHRGDAQLDTRHLLWGLYRLAYGAARELLTAVASDEQISRRLLAWLEAPENLNLLPSVETDPARLSLTSNCQQALEQAAALAGAGTLAGEAPSIRERQVLAGLLAVPDSEAARWLVQTVGLSAGALYGLVAVRGAEEPAVPLAEALHRARAIPVAALPCFVHLQASSTDLAEGTPFELTLHVTDEEVPGSQPLLVPESTLELTVYVNTSGFQPEAELPLTLPLPVATRSLASSLSLKLTPTREGEHELQVLVHPGRAEGAQPVRLTLPIWVARAARLPEIPEIIDQRAIPDPRPDVILYVALAPGGNTLQLYGILPALGRLRPTEMPALALSRQDVTALRETAIQAAVEAGDVPPADALASLRAIGAALFDRLMPEGHPLRALYWHHLYALSENLEQMPAWLIISEEDALLPWEMVCPYVPGGDGSTWHDHFLSESFVLAHWVSRKGLRLAGEAPLGKLGLIHYGQRPGGELLRWQAGLGGPKVVDVENLPGHLAPAGPDSARYGLHILRYTDAGTEVGLVTAAGSQVGGEPDEQGEALLQQRRLDLTLRRPVVGLSFLTEHADGAGTGLPLAARDSRLEASWLLPLLAARASALVGARWPVRPEVDQLFYRSFYEQMRAGAPLGWAVWYARRQVRWAFPHRADWLAYTYYGHPWCQPYLVRPGRGYTVFEQIDHPEDAPLLAGETYRFRASYRTEAPAWYTGRLRMQEAALAGEDLSVVVMPLAGGKPAEYLLQPVPGSQDYQHTLELTMPEEATTMTVMVRFQRADQEIRTMLVELDTQAKGQD